LNRIEKLLISNKLSFKKAKTGFIIKKGKNFTSDINIICEVNHSLKPSIITDLPPLNSICLIFSKQSNTVGIFLINSIMLPASRANFKKFETEVRNLIANYKNIDPIMNVQASIKPVITINKQIKL
jgi:hypothetical protein